MFYLCDNERKESVNRLINLIIYSELTYDEKVELKKDLKKISSIRCQNHIEPLYSIAIKKKIEEEEDEEDEEDEEENNKRIMKEREEREKTQHRAQRTSNYSYSQSKILTEMENKNSRYLQGLNNDEQKNYSKYEAIYYNSDDLIFPLTLYEFFVNLNLLNKENINYIFKIESQGQNLGLRVSSGPQTYFYIYINRDLTLHNLNKLHLNSKESDEGEKIINWKPKIYKSNDRFNIENINTVDFKTAIYEEIEEEIEEIEGKIEEGGQYVVGNIGGYAKSSKFKTKEVLGKLRRIYKIPNSKKEHIKHKGNLITVSEYKALMKLKKKYK